MKAFFKVLIIVILLSPQIKIQAQDQLMQDYSRLMEIPEIIEMEASASHLYVLSEKEGLAVFRSYPDSLQWLYTSEGMQKRGDEITADIRFAYLFGDSRRLTVLEPTSVFGVYSSTILPEKPKAAARINNHLFILLEHAGLGFVSLETPETLDSEVQLIENNELNNLDILDVKASDVSRQLFVLTDAPALFVYDFNENELQLSSQINLDDVFTKLFIDDEQLWGSTSYGQIFEVHANGVGDYLGTIDEPVTQIHDWNNRLVVRGKSGKVWASNKFGNLRLWKSDESAGNFIAESQNRLWISENNKVTEIYLGEETESASTTDQFIIKNIPKQVISYPDPLLIALEMEGNTSEDVEFSYRSNVENASIRKDGFYWQPTANQIGTQWFKILATNAEGQSDSIRFTVDVRSFNSPPRFSPVRTSSIAANEIYKVTFHAIDPEHPESSLIRYIGVDMPAGAVLNEKTGEFEWKPTERQVGETHFRIIATDKLGAASSVDVTLRVLDISRGE